MDQNEIMTHIDELVAQEHRLRNQGHALSEEDQAALRDAEEHLDQLWDLLRRRDALRRSGRNPDDAHEEPVAEVESYLQ